MHVVDPLCDQIRANVAFDPEDDGSAVELVEMFQLNCDGQL